jgi:GR25 family glycosyltransferase involved in LPS biosynthesis
MAFMNMEHQAPTPGIDFTYVNLASSSDRREVMERQIRRLGLNVARFEGIVPDHDPPGGRRSVLGCYLSHRGVIEGAASDTYTVVLEDDVDLAGIFAEAVSPATLEAVKHFDIVFLECLAFQHSFELLRGFHEVFRQGGERAESLTVFRPFTAYCAGACAYVVTPQGKRTLADVFARNIQRSTPEWAVDEIYLAAISEGQLQAALFAPFVASPGVLNGRSTIGYAPPTHAIIDRWQKLVDAFRRSLFVDIDPMEVAANVAAILPKLDDAAASLDHLQRQILMALDEILAEPG